MNIDENSLSSLLFDLIRIPSVNPSLLADSQAGSTQVVGEGEIARYVAEALTSFGLEVQQFEPQPGRVTVLGVLKGAGGGRSLMLNAHSDTVGVGGMKDAFAPSLQVGKVYGRGAQDMKGSLAAMLAAVKALAAGPKLGGDVLLAAVADEEYSSLGTMDLIEHLRIANNALDGAIVTEPTGLKIAAAHRGYVWLQLETIGRAAHGSRWWEGIDANRMMGRVLVELDDLAADLIQRPAHPLVGPPSLHTPLIRGGREMSIYADRCTVQIERRTIPGETPAGVTAEIQSRLDQLAAEDGRLKANLQAWLDRPPFESRPGSELLPVMIEQTGVVLGKAAAVEGIPFWTDAALLSAAGADVALIGPVGGGLHTDEEWVDLNSCVQLAEILAFTARQYCR